LPSFLLYRFVPRTREGNWRERRNSNPAITGQQADKARPKYPEQERKKIGIGVIRLRREECFTASGWSGTFYPEGLKPADS
jgi:hypothetical protein